MTADSGIGAFTTGAATRVLGLAREVDGHTDVVILGVAAHTHTPLGRVIIIVMVVLMLGLVVFVAWKSMGALHRLPRQRLSGRQRLMALAFMASEVFVCAVGLLVGYLVAQPGQRLSAMLVGGFAGGFGWLAMCWILGGVARRRGSQRSAGSSSAH